MHPKSFYYNYQANDDINHVDEMMNQYVCSTEPRSVFDFGCGVGKNLRYIKTLMSVEHGVSIPVCGLDMSFLNIVHARAKNNIDMLIIGDEYHLCRLGYFDTVTTTSVLCHIEDITDIIKELKRIGEQIIICETNDVVGEFYYPHDYESFGFELVGLESVSGNNALYKIYRWKK